MVVFRTPLNLDSKLAIFNLTSLSRKLQKIASSMVCLTVTG